jgi:negative regulator of sigma E activity
VAQLATVIDHPRQHTVVCTQALINTVDEYCQAVQRFTVAIVVVVATLIGLQQSRAKGKYNFSALR